MSIYSRTKTNYRKIYEQHHGPIPKGYHIHHIDGNHENNDASNLEALPAKEHYDKHYEQGDYGACWAMYVTGHISLTPEQRSEISSKTQLKLSKDGRHPFQLESTKVKTRDKTIARNKSMAGKTFEELYGEEKAKEIKESISSAGKGKVLKLSDEERLARSERSSGDNNPIHKLTEKENKDRIEKLKKTLSEYYSNNDGKNKGKICYTDGKINIFLEKNVDPPEGFYKGRAKQETVKCPHCNKIGPKPQMKQWHFDNCKQKEKNK